MLAALAQLPFHLAAELDAAEVSRQPVTIVGDDPRVDVLTVAWTLTFDRAWPNRVVRRIEGTRVPFVELTDLLRSKRTGRPSDDADILALKELHRSSRSRSHR